MSEFTESILERKLSNLTLSLDKDSSIKPVSTWIISHRRHFQVICATFYKVLVRTNKDKTIILLYLVHEIVQMAKNKHSEFIIEFGNLMKKILEYLVESDYLDIKSNTSIWDLIQKWRKHKIFDTNKQDDFETIWKMHIGIDKSTLKREKSHSITPNDLPEKRPKTSKLDLKLYCLLCQEYGHVSHESCHIHARCRNCGIKGHMRNNCLKTIDEYTEGEKLNLMKDQKIEEKAHLNENRIVSNSSIDDDDVIILKQKVGGTTMKQKSGGTTIPIVTITLEDNEGNDELKNKVKSHKEKCNDEGLGCGMREVNTAGTEGGLWSEVDQLPCELNLKCQEVNNNSTLIMEQIVSGTPSKENSENSQCKNRKECAQDIVVASKDTHSQHTEPLHTNDNDSIKNKSPVSKDIFLESGSKIPTIVDVFNKQRKESHVNYHPAEVDKQLEVENELLKWENNYVPPKNESMDQLNSSSDNDDVVFMAEVAGHAVSEMLSEKNSMNSIKKKINEEKEKMDYTIKTVNSQHSHLKDTLNVTDLNPVTYLNKLAGSKNNVTIAVDLSQNLDENGKEINPNEFITKIPSLMDIPVKEPDSNSFEYKNWPKKVLFFTITNVQNPINVDVMYKICSNAIVNVGIVLRIVTFERHVLQCLVEFDTEKAAKQAKDTLHDTNIYKWSCSLNVQYARKSELKVSKNDEKSWDFTTGFKQNCRGMDDSIMTETKNTRISQDHGNNVPEDRSCVVMVYSTTPEKMNCNVLFNLFSQYGNINCVVFMRKRAGHAMLEMEDPESAERAIRHLNRATLFGYQIKLSVCRRYKTLANMNNTFQLPDGTGAIQDYRGRRNNNLSVLFYSPTKYLLFQNLPKMEKVKINRLFVDNGAPRPSRMKWFNAKYENSPSDMGMMEFASIEEACDALALVNHIEVISLQVDHMLPSTLKLSFAPPTY